MPHLGVLPKRAHYKDHDTDVKDLQPPERDVWYELFDSEDVRLMWCVLHQSNDGAIDQGVEVRWTIDGNVYFTMFTANNLVTYYIYRDHQPSQSGTAGLGSNSTVRTAGIYGVKMGQRIKVEVRMTGFPGTNQRFAIWTVKETLEDT